MLKKIFFIVVSLFVVDLYLGKKEIQKKYLQLDKELGWSIKKNLNQEYNNFTLNNLKYKTIMTSSNVKGFQLYEEPSNDSKKIFILGDSFVVNSFHGSNYAFWKTLKSQIEKDKKEKIQFYVAGAPGYSSVQQFILAKKYIKKINPDIFILGFCSSNDFLENNVKNAENSIVRNQNYFRPYLNEKNKIYFLNGFKHKTFRFFYSKSFFFRKIDYIVMLLQQKYYGGYYKTQSKNISEDDIDATIKILTKLNNLLVKNKVFISLDCSIEPNIYQKEWKKIIQSLNGIAIDNIGKLVYEKSKINKKIYHIDGFHMSKFGHKIYGEELYMYLKNNNLLKIK